MAINQSRPDKIKHGFSSLDDLVRQADVSVKSLQAIANADGFSSLNLDRRQALWAARGLARHRLHDMPLFAHARQRHERLAGIEPAIMLPPAGLVKMLLKIIVALVYH